MRPGRMEVISNVCDCVRALNETRLELSTPNTGDTHYSRPACTDPEVKGQGQAVMTCAAVVGMQVDMIA